MPLPSSFACGCCCWLLPFRTSSPHQAPSYLPCPWDLGIVGPGHLRIWTRAGHLGSCWLGRYGSYPRPCACPLWPSTAVQCNSYVFSHQLPVPYTADACSDSDSALPKHMHLEFPTRPTKPPCHLSSSLLSASPWPPSDYLHFTRVSRYFARTVTTKRPKLLSPSSSSLASVTQLPCHPRYPTYVVHSAFRCIHFPLPSPKPNVQRRIHVISEGQSYNRVPARPSKPPHPPWLFLRSSPRPLSPSSISTKPPCPA